MIRFSFVVFACTLLSVGSVRAQEAFTILPPDFVLSDLLNRQRLEQAIGRPLDGPETSQTAPRTARPTQPKPAPKPAGSTRYTASPEVSRKVTADFVAMVRTRVGVAASQELDTSLKANDAVANWGQIVGGDGLKPGDLADAFAGYWILNWVMANGADNTRTQTLAVRDQVRPILASLGTFSDAQKQEVSETFMLNFLVQHAVYMDAMQRGDTALMRKLGEAARTRFRTEMGIDLRALKLTDSGFQPA